MESGKYQDEELYLTTYDGSGKEIYSRVFKGLKITNRENDFNYSSSDVSCHLVSLSYETCETYETTNRVHKTYPQKTQIDHLNARFYVE